MKPTNDLFLLVKSLSKSEKRYFKLAMSLQKGNKIYMQVFDIIEKQKEYNEEAIKQKFKGEALLNQFHVRKNQLYNLILKSMRGYYANSSAATKLRGQLMDAELLYGKALYDQAKKVIAKAKKTARQYEHFEILLELLKFEMLASGRAYKSIKAERENILSKVNSIYQYEFLNIKMFLLFLKEGFIKNPGSLKSLKNIISEKVMLKDFKRETHEMKFYYYNIYSYYSDMQGDFEDSYRYMKKALEAVESKAYMQNESVYSSNYITTLANLYSTCVRIKKYDEAHAITNKILGFPDASPHNIRKIVIPHYVNILDWYLQTGKFEDGIKYFDTIKILLDKVDAYHLTHGTSTVLYYNMAQIYFGMARYSDALHWIEKMLNETETDIREDAHSSARILKLIILYEMNSERMERWMQRNKKFISSKSRLFTVEKIMFEFFGKILPKLYTRKETSEAYRELKIKIDKTLSPEKKQVLDEYFDFSSWVEAKIGNVPFAEIIKKKAATYPFPPLHIQ